MASNSGIKTLSRNKVLSNYFMYKFMKKNETKKSFGKFLSWRQLWCCCLMLIGGLLLTDRPAFSQATTQANVSLKLKQVTVLDALRELNRQYNRQLMFKREEVEQVKEPGLCRCKKGNSFASRRGLYPGNPVWWQPTATGLLSSVLRGKPRLLFPG